MSYEEQMDAYYRLKREFAEKNGAFSTLPGLAAEKRANMKCVGCRKPGGTVFTEDGDGLRAVCGAEQKCGLDLTVRKPGPVVLLPVLLQASRDRLEEEKAKLIGLKIRHALGAITDEAVINEFEQGRIVLEKVSAALAAIDQKLLTVTDSPDRHAAVVRLKTELYTAVQEFKSNLREFRETGRDAYLMDALEFQMNTMTPIVTELRDTIYAKNLVEYADDEYKLIQERYTLKELEVPIPNELRELLGDKAPAGFAKITGVYSISDSVRTVSAGFL